MTALGSERQVMVGLGELQTATEEGVALVALGLGSCIAVALYDPRQRVGGMAHVVLPRPLDTVSAPTAKFATVAVPLLLERVLALGAQRRQLVCKIAGGAQVLTSGPQTSAFRIGERNIEAVLDELTKLGLRPAAQECGGHSGRSLRLRVHDGRVAVKCLGQDWQDL